VLGLQTWKHTWHFPFFTWSQQMVQWLFIYIIISSCSYKFKSTKASICLYIIILFVSWLVKKLYSQILILCFCCGLYHGGPPQKKKKNLREHLRVTIVNCVQGDDLIGWLIRCANWQLKAKQDCASLILYDIIITWLIKDVIGVVWTFLIYWSWQEKSTFCLIFLA